MSCRSSVAMTVWVIVAVVMVMVMVMVFAMTVSRATMVSAICATFRFKRFFHRVENQVHRSQHVGQYRIRFNFEVIGLEFYGHMSIAQVVCRPS